MKRIHPVSRPRGVATAVTTEVKLTYVMNLIEITVPLVQDKDPQNPGEGTDTGDDEGDTTN